MHSNLLKEVIDHSKHRRDTIFPTLTYHNQQREEIRDNNCSTAAVSTMESRVHEYWLVEELMLETKYARLNLHEVAE